MIRTVARLAVVALAVVTIPLTGNGAQAATDRLGTNGTLGAGQALVSADGRYQAAMQADGNFVVYNSSHQATWNSGTSGTGNGGFVAMQSDGNLVVYTASARATWSSSTAPEHNASLVMQSDGNLVMYDDSGRAAWSAYTGPTGVHSDRLNPGNALHSGQSLWSTDSAYRAVMQSDGNFVVYTSSNVATWNTSTGGTGDGGQVVMQTDGNLVTYTSSGRATWASSTAPSSSDTLVMQSDGNLVIYSGGTALWSAYTGKIGGASGASNTFGYPDQDAIDCSVKYGKSSWCKGGSWLSGRGFGYRNCTDFAAFKRGITWGGIPFPKGSNGQPDGNASNWKQGWINKGWSVSTTPRVGDVAWWPASSSNSFFGHVAIVTAVNSDRTVNIQQYNAKFDGNPSTANNVTATAYLH